MSSGLTAAINPPYKLERSVMTQYSNQYQTCPITVLVETLHHLLILARTNNIADVFAYIDLIKT